MTKITFAFAAALASITFATAAVAQEGNYYEGARSTPPGSAQHRSDLDRYGYTGSIVTSSEGGRATTSNTGVNSGDYYRGAVRPNS